MQPIVPKGYDINQFPKALDASQLAVREVSATLAKSNESIQETKRLIGAQINQYSTFFVAHFGLNVVDEMQKKFFPPGHSVRQGGGAGNTLGIAQEIMAYKDPAPESVGLTLPVVIAILNGFLRIPHEQAENQEREAERMRFVEDAIFKLDYRPTRDSIEAGKQLPNFDGPQGRGGLGRQISYHTNTGKIQSKSHGWKYGYTSIQPTGSVLRYIWKERPSRWI